MFIDIAKIEAASGAGGKGCNSFYRDKLNRRGFPDGGEGGKGGDVVIQADENVDTLLDFKYRRHFHAPHGAHGSGKNKKGKAGEDVIAKVPVGVVVKDASSNLILRDLNHNGDRVIVAKGGAGGKGNSPRHEATQGGSGEMREVSLELKLIADVGLVGYPNAGKSSLLSVISKARPKIANFPFTTLSPVLGTVNAGGFIFKVADIPGLIEGAHEGRGLGHEFLRHIERTKVLVHLIDMASIDGRDPVLDYELLNKELFCYNEALGRKPQVAVANKMDLEAALDNLKRFRAKYRKLEIIPISCEEKTGLEPLLKKLRRELEKKPS